MSERFCWKSRKVGIPVMCYEESSHRSKRDTLYICVSACVCVWRGGGHMCAYLRVISGPCRPVHFADKSCPENRDATHQRLGQRELKSSV